jgi:hypothetical protein
MLAELIKQAFDVLATWPLVQGAVAILVLVIASLLAWSSVRRQVSPQVSRPAPPVPVQIESPWLVQHLVEMHLDIERIKTSQEAGNAKLDAIFAAVTGAVVLLRRRNKRKSGTKEQG